MVKDHSLRHSIKAHRVLLPGTILISVQNRPQSYLFLRLEPPFNRLISLASNQIHSNWPFY